MNKKIIGLSEKAQEKLMFLLLIIAVAIYFALGDFFEFIFRKNNIW